MATITRHSKDNNQLEQEMEQEEEMVEEVVWHWRLEARVQIQGCWKPLLRVWQQYNNSCLKSKNSVLRSAFTTHQYQGIAAGIQHIHRQPDQVLLTVAQNQIAIQQQLAQPAAAAAPAADGNINNPNNASLSHTPRSLFELWTKWTVGIGGRKPAKDFTAAEHGREKFKYSRRKVVWELIASLVWSGLTAVVAIDRIYAMYGAGTSVTNIINQLKKNVCDGTLHLTLRVYACR
jgi:hypothetical protein